MTDRKKRFEAALLPHLNAAHNLARWLLRDDVAAGDVVQESFLRAFRFFDALKGEHARPWLLGIVRNACYDWLKESKAWSGVEFDEERDSEAIDPIVGTSDDNPVDLLLRKDEAERLNRAIERLPPVFREVIILRELEELSYEEIARITATPIGTVMSRLARSRQMLRRILTEAGKEYSE